MRKACATNEVGASVADALRGLRPDDWRDGATFLGVCAHEGKDVSWCGGPGLGRQRCFRKRLGA